jgi:CHAT domain-containing protein
VTHWEIDTFAAIELTRRIAGEMRQLPDASPAEVLRSAIKAMLEENEAARFHHPRFWASHVVIGL